MKISTRSHRRTLSMLVVGVALIVPSAAHGSSVDWQGDAETGDKRQWACEALNPGLVTVSASQALSGRYGYRFENRDGVGTRWGGERQELGQGNCVDGKPSGGGAKKVREGDEKWLAFAVRLGDDFPFSEPRPGNYWSGLWQTHTDGCGWPILSVSVEDGYFDDALMFSHNVPNQSTCTGRGAGAYPLSTGPAKRGVWHKVTVHARFSSNPAKGFYEVWYREGDGPQVKAVPRKRAQTMLPGVDAHQRIGYYRSEDFVRTGSVYHDGFTEASTKRAAEVHAFGGR